MGGAFSSKGKPSALPARTPVVPEFRLKAILVGSPFSGRSSIFERYINNLFDYENRGSPHTLRMGSKVWLVREPTGGLAYVNLWDTPRYIDRMMGHDVPVLDGLVAVHQHKKQQQQQVSSLGSASAAAAASSTSFAASMPDRDAATETGGQTLWTGAGVIFVCVDGKECKDLEAEVSKWCQDPVIQQARDVCGSIICVLITKADALQAKQEERVKETMGRMIQMPDLALDTWALCSAKTSRGLQGPEDIIKILFHQYVKDEAKRQKKQAGKNRRSLMGVIGDGTDSLRASIVGGAASGPRASLFESAGGRKTPRRSLACTSERCSTATVQNANPASSRNSVIPLQYRPSVMHEPRPSKPACRSSVAPEPAFIPSAPEEVV